MDFATAISFNIMSSSSNRNQDERRPSNPGRSIPARPHGGYFRNGNSSTERNRPIYRERNLSDRHNANSNNVQIRLSLKSDVKLKEAENAWKPSFLNKASNTNKQAEAELYKQVRSILNKLTAQNFAVLSEQFQNLPIDSKEKLVEVINLVFNKAVNEPHFSEGYAKLNEYLSQRSKQIDSSSSECACSMRTLITKCQIEFEQHVANKNATEVALDKMTLCEKAGDSTGANELKAQIAEEESNLRRRLVSTVRFIGELYKLDMLTTKIMDVCINTLIVGAANANKKNADQANEKLECLCKLLTTVGGKLEQKPINDSNKAKAQFLDLKNYMNQLKRFVDNKNQNFKPSTRIKFMIMDVIELRNNRWMPKITTGLYQNQTTN